MVGGDSTFGGGATVELFFSAGREAITDELGPQGLGGGSAFARGVGVVGITGGMTGTGAGSFGALKVDRRGAGDEVRSG